MPTETPLVNDSLWKEMKRVYESKGADWTPTTQEMMDEMMNVLPPQAWGPSAFLVGEPCPWLDHQGVDEAAEARSRLQSPAKCDHLWCGA